MKLLENEHATSKRERQMKRSDLKGHFQSQVPISQRLQSATVK